METSPKKRNTKKRSGGDNIGTNAEKSNSSLPSTEIRRSEDVVPSANPKVVADPARLRKKPKTIRIIEEVKEEDDDDPDSPAAATKKKKLRRVDFAAEGDAFLLGTPAAGVPILDDVRPTAVRLTEKGGYLHTKQSRMKISQANQGKSPWNKGKERTESAKAKISAGVKARNQALLLQKLQTLNMTEEEWYAKKKQIKLQRERVRKARIAAAKFQQEQLELQQQKKEAVLFITENDVTAEPSIESEALKPKASRTRTAPEEEEATPTVPDPEPEPSPQNAIPAFSRDIQFTPHVLDTPNLKYDMLCPHGGPGGLICCHSCMVQYSKYLTSTFQDMERYATEKVGKEVQELLDDTCAAKQRLVQTMKVARRKPIPIRHYTMATTFVNHTKPAAASVLTTTEEDPTAMEFPDVLVKEEI